jgi:Leucine-rich repeat (LRR) protein
MRFAKYGDRRNCPKKAPILRRVDSSVCHRILGRSPIILTLCLCTAAFPAVAPQDSVAAWIRNAGGSLQKNQAGQIVEVDLTSTWITDDDLARIAALTGLRKLNLSYTKITDLGLEHLRPLRNVTWLNCYYCEYLTDSGIAFLKQWSNLEYLNLRGTEVTSRVFEHISHMKKLRSLDVGFSRVNDDGFDALASLDKLEELHIGGDKMTGLALPLLRLLPSLKRLDLNGSQRTDSGRWGLMLTDVNVESLSALTQLEFLNMGGAMVSDVGMKALAPLVNLETLDLSRMDITSTGLEPLIRLPKLRRLNLWQSARIDDKAAPYLLRMKNLETLDLSDTSVTGALLDQLEGMKQLKLLFLAGAKVTAERVEQFRHARPDCRVVWAPKYKEVKSPEDTRLIG